MKRASIFTKMVNIKKQADDNRLAFLCDVIADMAKINIVL